MIDLEVAARLNGHTEPLPPDLFQCSTGIVLNLHRVKRQLVHDAANSIPEPRIPVWHNPDKDRDEENPLDPNYIAARQKYNRDVGAAGMNMYLMFGTSIKMIPEGMPKVDEAWDADYAEVGIVIPAKGRPRYLAWLKYVALEDEEEQLKCITKVMEFAGLVTEEQVVGIMSTFRSDETGGTDTGADAS